VRWLSMIWRTAGGEVSKRGRNLTAQLVPAEMQLPQVGEIAELGWIEPLSPVEFRSSRPILLSFPSSAGIDRSVIVAERHPLEVAEVPELRRDRTIKLVRAENHSLRL